MTTTNTNICLKIIDVIKKGKNALWNLNLFQSVPPTQDDFTLRKQHLSTRLFLLLFILCLIVFTIYNSQIASIQWITVKDPSYLLYKKLYAKYPSTLTCPCTTIAIPNKNFLRPSFSYHEVCSSAFIRREWSGVLSNAPKIYGTFVDFRYIGPLFFQMLTTLWSLANQSIANELLTFGDTLLITANVMPVDLFHEQTMASIDLLISNLESNYMRFVSLIRTTTRIDGHISGLFTNVDYLYVPFDEYWLHAYSFPRTFPNNCTCSLETACTSPAFITLQGTTSGPLLEFVSGIYFGCHIIDGLLQSTLELLFDQKEINHVLRLLLPGHYYEGVFAALDSRKLQRFTVKTSIHDLASRLFVDVWTKTSSHEEYFLSCRPTQCHYSYVGKHNIIVIITIIAGMIGGLNTILRLLVPIIVQIMFWVKGKIVHTNATLTSVVTEVRNPRYTRIRTALITIKNFIFNYNMFPSNSVHVNEHEIRSQKISTLLFIILVSISFMILAVYNALQQVATTTTVKEPDYNTYRSLFLRHSDKLSCLCTTVSVEQGMFIDVKSTFHPVCSSDFISLPFLNHLLPISYSDYVRFLFIDLLCHLSNTTINESLSILKKARFISKEVLSNELFDKYIQDIIDQHIQTMTDSFAVSLSFIRNMTSGNKLMGGHANNILILLPTTPGLFDTNYFTAIYQRGRCDCLIESCISSSQFITPEMTFVVPGFYSGCYMIDSILRSDLQCLYDFNCTTLYLSLFNVASKLNISTLDSSATRFSIYTPFEKLVQDLLVENWTTNWSHINYFNQCKPSNCFYTIQTKHNWIIILTVTIALLGGIQVILRFIVPKTVRFIYQRCIVKHHIDNNREEVDLSPENSRSSTIKHLKTSLRNYNIYPSFSPIVDVNIHRKQILGTRFFIFAFIISLITIAIFNISVSISTTMIVNSPNYTEYLDLYSQYEQRLECPCTSIAVPYSNFVETNITFHQICSSVYVESIWPRIVFASIQGELVKRHDDFRSTAPHIFQVIGSFCQLGNDSVQNKLISFTSQQLISNTIIQKNIFTEQMHSSLNLFVNTMENDFDRTLNVLQGITASNVLVSLTRSNVYLTERPGNGNERTLIPVYASYQIGNSTTNYCACQPPAICFRQSVIKDAQNQDRFVIPGMVVSCFPVYAVLHSTLSCFFNQSCINILRSIFKETTYNNIELDTPALDSSLPSRYSSETRLDEIVKHLMIDNFSWNASHERYFENCRPSICLYMITNRNNAIYVLTAILGLMGGLSKVLHIITPYLVTLGTNLIKWFCCCRHHRVQDQPS